MRPDTKILEEIAAGPLAEAALETFGEILDTLVESTMGAADNAIDKRRLTGELAVALLHEACAYRRILARLRQKVSRAENAKAALSTDTVN